MSGKFEKTFVLEASPERVWRAFTEPGEMEAWQRDRVELFELRPGGRVRYQIIGRTIEGTVDDVQPHRRLQWTAGPGVLPGPTVITVTFEQAEAAPASRSPSPGLATARSGSPSWRRTRWVPAS